MRFLGLNLKLVLMEVVLCIPFFMKGKATNLHTLPFHYLYNIFFLITAFIFFCAKKNIKNKFLLLLVLYYIFCLNTNFYPYRMEEGSNPPEHCRSSKSFFVKCL